MKQQHKAFMGQFALARKEVQDMPEWLRESARVATLTYPSIKPGVPIEPQAQPQKKKKT